MAGRGPAPKPPELRQRTNRMSTHAKLPSEAESAENDVPPLFVRDDGKSWHPMVLEWWDAVWRSGMASEFLGVDMRGGLYLLANLYQIGWTTTSKAAFIEATKEIRLQEVRFGLSPMDRRRLQWEVNRGEQAEKQMERRRMPKPDPTGDPRANLKAV